MSTHSNIGKRLPNGTYRYVYCHFDGYPSGVGRILLEHYQDEAKIDALLDLGELSSLGGTLESSVAYARDRGEHLTPADIATSRDDVFEQSYAYVWGRRQVALDRINAG